MSDFSKNVLRKLEPNKAPAMFKTNVDDKEAEAKAFKETVSKVAENNNIDAPEIDSKEFLEYVSDVYGFATTLLNPSPKDDSARFEWHSAQLAWLKASGSNTATFKCRQSGFSYVVSAFSSCKSQVVNQDYSILFMSIVKAEAQNKILYCKELIESMPSRFRRKIKYETKQSIEFLNKDGTVSRILSHAQKPARGHHGDIIYDEADFYQNFTLLYDAGYPSTKKIGGQTHIISTPFDPYGLFCRIVNPKVFYGSAEFKDEFSEYQRFKITWWHIPYYCKDMVSARAEAFRLTTEQRVNKFGTKLLIEAFNNSTSLEVFQQEYEATFLEKVSLFFSPTDIKQCIVRDFEEIIHHDFSLDFSNSVDQKIVDKDNSDFQFYGEKILLENKVIPKLYSNPKVPMSIVDLQQAVASGKVAPRLIGGHDVATSGDSADIQIYEIATTSMGDYLLVPRFWITIENWRLPDQQEFVEKQILEKLPIIKYGMDTHGIGMSMGQYFELKYPSVFQSIPMLSGNLDLILPALKDSLHLKRHFLPPYNEFAQSLNGVRRDISSSNNAVWKLKRKKGGHCDSAISAGIASYLAHQLYGIKGSGKSILGVSNRIAETNVLNTKNSFGNSFKKNDNDFINKAKDKSSKSLDRSMRRSGLNSDMMSRLLGE